ncbi:MAG: selenocysteine-specific translation elongation factor, partial [Candidatus Cloacimonetes bacterium]|nr:selenocysteine-specific translation elongation factor [Candidatus Cloacimonadota bacterium]
MKHLIMGTAGHIDHGKTALIKALTNIDCDTHKEEKLRGITINLGFAHIDLPNDESIGIIDVPGHRDFVNTMVAGVSSIDFVMLVIAADSGVMPQTVEHLKIMEILGVKKGFVVLTKIDLVDEEMIQIAEEEILEFIKGTFLENFPIIKVSVKTGEGISELKEFLSEMSYKVEERQRGKLFRMFIDRIFSIKGFGTIVNGSVISGHLEKKNSVYLLPGAKKLRIRRMERHGNEVEEITAGDRASLNLVGLNRDDFKRGMIVSDRILQPTKLIDAKLNLFQHNRNFEIWTQAVFILGTYQAQTRIHLIDRNILEPGQAAIVQIHLDPPCIPQYGDRFVIRSSSCDITLGGGEIIDAHPLHHRRRTKKLINELHKITEGGISELIAAEVRKRLTPVSYQDIANILNIPKQNIQEAVSKSLPEDIVVISSKEKGYLMLKKEKDKLERKIIRNLETFHKRNPFDELGRTFEELVGLFGINRDSTTENMMKLILEEMTDSNKLKKVHHTWSLKSHNVVLSSEDKMKVGFVEDYIQNSGMKTPLISELIPKAKAQDIDENRLKQILNLLTNQ